MRHLAIALAVVLGACDSGSAPPTGDEINPVVETGQDEGSTTTPANDNLGDVVIAENEAIDGVDGNTDGNTELPIEDPVIHDPSVTVTDCPSIAEYIGGWKRSDIGVPMDTLLPTEECGIRTIGDGALVKDGVIYGEDLPLKIELDDGSYWTIRLPEPGECDYSNSIVQDAVEPGSTAIGVCYHRR